MPSDIAAITCVFNPAEYKQPRKNFDRFTAKLEQDGIAWYAIELAFFDRPFSLPPASNIFQYRSDTILWHKENLLNVLAGKLPPQIRKVVWCDCDLLFSSPDWWKQASEMLEQKVVIQPFEDACWQSADGEAIYKVKKSFLHFFQNSPREILENDEDWIQSHSGFAWAARREFFEKGGLYPYHIVGSGDSCMAAAFAGISNRRFRGSEKMGQCLDAYARQMEWIDKRLGYLPGISVTHLWHGTRKNRNYQKRRRIYHDFDFDPLVDISTDANGMWQWATDKPALHKAVAKYFHSRREDQVGWRQFLFRLGLDRLFRKPAQVPLTAQEGSLPR